MIAGNILSAASDFPSVTPEKSLVLLRTPGSRPLLAFSKRTKLSSGAANPEIVEEVAAKKQRLSARLVLFPSSR